MTPPFERQQEQATEAPLQWAPVLAMLIHNHCYHIPHSAYRHWLQALHSHRFEDASEPAATMWLLRCLHELAVAWPAALTAAEDSSDAAGADTSTSLLESQWKVQSLRTFDFAHDDYHYHVFFQHIHSSKSTCCTSRHAAKRLRLCSIHCTTTSSPAEMTAGVGSVSRSLGTTPRTNVWRPACMQGEQAVWDNVLTWLSTTTSKPAVQECGVALLAVLADRGLAANLQLRSPQLWSLPVLQQGSLVAPSAHLIRAAFTQGACMAMKFFCWPRACMPLVRQQHLPAASNGWTERLGCCGLQSFKERIKSWFAAVRKEALLWCQCSHAGVDMEEPCT